ncbi:hypothetical protein KEM60_00948 [Austwickia sp. TVS 96-490-7B]|uniref:class I SAM-dependent methyltransferase n=1 Tax=Austwickia sp. TVS 96-490-7B TaxID=2830843 RepID=UPI001C5788FC|nr:class I SAM-dependent methyltransferase [Austwickia sp. TVS 96-490-7B]MBW3084759.1 hypothetical protein [Austwickia sp. TVS 96-490-7B]
MDITLVERLLSAEGWALLGSLPPYDDATSLKLGEALRDAGYDGDLVAAALTQSRLRARARNKLGDFADGMLLTPDGLEQATRLEIAARHAGRFRAAGVPHLWDLGCGIGADAMAASALGLSVTAVDSDPATAAIAGVNLRHFPDADSRVGDATQIAALIPTEDGAWFDPARRIPGTTDAHGRTRRTFRLDDLSPAFSTILETAARVPATGAKLSPSLSHSAIPAGCEAQWISFYGEVLECTLWWGPLVHHQGRTALVLSPQGTETLVTEQDTDPGAGGLGPVTNTMPTAGQYVWDPDRAVIRAGLVGALTAATDGAELSHGVGYVVSSRPIDLPYARRYEVIDALPLQTKTVRSWLRQHGIGRLVIKKRGAQVDPDTFRKDLHLDGNGEELTCLLTRVGSRQAFIAVRPC